MHTLSDYYIKHFLVALYLSLSTTGAGQVTIATQTFEAGTSTVGYANTGGTTYTGNSTAASAPANAAFFTSSTTAFGISSGTGTVTLNNTTGLTSYTSKYFEFRLASWSITTNGNGADAGDNVIVSVSLDNTSYSSELRINGNSNAYWHYNTGTGIATTSYDGNNTPTVLAAGGGGSRTTDGYSTVRIALPDNCTQARLRIAMVNDNANERWTIDDIKLIGTLSAPCVVTGAPSAPASALSAAPGCTSAAINLTQGNGAKRIVVVSASDFTDVPVNATAYSANTAFGTLGSTVGTGNYVVYNGTGTSVNVTGLTASTAYYVKVFEYNGTGTNCDESYLTAGVTSYSFTTSDNCATPQIRSILVDACSSQEGIDELILVQNGSNSLSIASINIGFYAEGNYCNSGCGSNTLGNNASYVAQLNSAAGCTLFQYADPIPAGGKIIIFTGQEPSYVFDYSSQCPNANTFYPIFCNNTSTTGRFANNGTGMRDLTISFGSSTDYVEYNRANISGDGSFVNFDDAGTPTYDVEPNCIYPLGVEMASFTTELTNSGVVLNWKTLSEKNADYFSVMRSGSEISFSSIGEVKCAGNSESIRNYTFTDRNPVSGINYYRLSQTDYDGKTAYSQILAINTRPELAVSYLKESEVLLFEEQLSEGTSVLIYDLSGQIVSELLTDHRTNSLPVVLKAGIYLVNAIDSKGNRISAKIAAM